mmetsp:Transcript_20637/g.19629  ORF Transcript_20637/g.19629 Transcript_20637/m.19629 type:complete len:99 (+) Transcript_20637:1677-1973(+)
MILKSAFLHPYEKHVKNEKAKAQIFFMIQQKNQENMTSGKPRDPEPSPRGTLSRNIQMSLVDLVRQRRASSVARKDYSSSQVRESAIIEERKEEEDQD